MNALKTKIETMKAKLEECSNVLALILTNANTNPHITLEYIKGTGTQYIDTGIKMNKTDTILYVIDNKLSNNSWGGTNAYLQYQLDDNYRNRCIVKNEYNGSNYTQKLYIDDILVKTNSWSSFSGNNHKIGILKMGDSNDTWFDGNVQIGNIYSCRIYKNNELVRDFIPVKRHLGDIICLYDKISQSYFENAGTGEFIAGGVING